MKNEIKSHLLLLGCKFSEGLPYQPSEEEQISYNDEIHLVCAYTTYRMPLLDEVGHGAPHKYVVKGPDVFRMYGLDAYDTAYTKFYELVVKSHGEK